MASLQDQQLSEINWRGLIGHEQVQDRLFALVASEKMPPVLLLEGRPGIGKSMLAASLVARYFCSEGIACGQCNGCQWVRTGNHPEVLWIDSKGEQLKVPVAEAVMDHLSLSPQLSGYEGRAKPARIVVIIDIDLMNEIAVNKLLKLFEEPPELSRIILTSSRAHSLLPTLLSRANKWKIRPPEVEEIKEIIKNECEPQFLKDLDSYSLDSLIQRNGLSPGKAIQAISEVKANELSEACRELMDPKRILAVIDTADTLAAMKIPAGEIARESEIALNQRYRSQFLGKSKPHVKEAVQGIKSRREVLKKIKYFGGRKKIALNAMLSAEGIGLSKFELNPSK